MDSLLQPQPTNRFLTTFIVSGVPSPLDIAFQRVTGLSRELNVTGYSEGGENSNNFYFANKITHGALVLERGVMSATPVAFLFDRVLRGEGITYADVVIILLDHHAMPVCSWTVGNALPVHWQTCDLDANATTISVNSLTLRYQSMRWLGVKA